MARLREWLFVNVMAGVANGDAEVAAFVGSRDVAPPRPNYTDTLAAVTAVQRQVEALGSDLAGALQLIAGRAQTLVRASGAAIALADADPDFMVCRASSGADAPPVGARLAGGFRFFRRVREERYAAPLRRLRNRCRAWIAKAAAPWAFVPFSRRQCESARSR